MLLRNTRCSAQLRDQCGILYDSVLLDCPAEHDLLNRRASLREIGRAHVVIDLDDVLLDDRAFVKVCCGVMSRRADQLDAAIVRRKV